LLREKQSVEIIGAIDTDPQSGTRPRRVVGASDAPWGESFADAAEVWTGCDVVMHTTSSSLRSDGPVVACLEASRAWFRRARNFVSVPDVSGADHEARYSGERVGVALVGTGVNPGFVMTSW